MSFSERLESWKKVALSPVAAFADEAAKSERGFKDGLENYGTPLLLVYLPLMAIGMIMLGQFNIMLPVAVLFGVGTVAFFILIATLVYAAISYAVSMLLGGKAPFGRLYYMISLPFAPMYTINGAIAILSMIIGALLGNSVGGIMSTVSMLAGILLALYGLYMLTLSLDALYRYGKLKAVIAWLVPTIVMAGIVIVMFGVALFSMLGLMAKGY